MWRRPIGRKLGGMTSPELHHHLAALNAERATASLEGIDDGPYVADLRAEIAATRSALVGAAVTEIATFRARLAGPQEG